MPSPAGRPDAGAIVFKKCMACHQIGPNAQNGIAPVLNGVVGRPAGRVSKLQLLISEQELRLGVGRADTDRVISARPPKSYPAQR